MKSLLIVLLLLSLVACESKQEIAYEKVYKKFKKANIYSFEVSTEAPNEFKELATLINQSKTQSLYVKQANFYSDIPGVNSIEELLKVFSFEPTGFSKNTCKEEVMYMGLKVIVMPNNHDKIFYRWATKDKKYLAHLAHKKNKRKVYELTIEDPKKKRIETYQIIKGQL